MSRVAILGRTHLIEAVDLCDLTDLRSHTGGGPDFATGQDWPTCPACNERMVYYFQLVLSVEFGLPFKHDSTLLVFACAKHCEIELFQKSDLPKEYWQIQRSKSKCVAYLNPPGTFCSGPEEPRLRRQSLRFESHTEAIHRYLNAAGEEQIFGEHAFKVGGEPGWLQDPLHYRCPCGAPMVFICQTHSDTLFQRREGAPAQELDMIGGSFFDEYYQICGPEACYFFACVAQCSRESVLVISQR